MAIRFKETDVRPMGRPAAGVKGIELQEADGSTPADEVVSMIIIPHNELETCMVLTACDNGFGKRTPVSDYRLIRRGGKGVINIKTTERNGNVVGLRAVSDADELMLITENGILMRTRVSEIRETGRNAQGVKLIRVDDGDRLVAMAKIDVEAKEGDEESVNDASSAPSQAPSTQGTDDAPVEDVADDADQNDDADPDNGADDDGSDENDQ